MIFEISILAGLILLNGFFAMSELAIVSARPSRLRQLADEGHKGAAAALKLSADSTDFLSTVQVGITLIGIIAGAYSGATFARPLATLIEGLPVVAGGAYALSFALVVATTTYLSLIVGELVPKRIALNNAETIAGHVAPTMLLLSKIGAPAVWFLSLSTETVLKLLRVKPNPDNAVSEDDVRAMIAEGAAAGVFDQAESDMLEQVFRLGDRPVRSLMVPRPDVAWVSLSDPLSATLEEALASGHSRFPVCRDTIDEVVGVVHVKGLLRLVHTQSQDDLEHILEEPLYVIASMPAMRLLDRLRQTSVHMAIVVDEYGSFEGIVTPMDILQAIAGDLPEHEDDQEPLATQRADGSWLVDASIGIDDAERTLGALSLEDGAGYTTLAGFLLHRLGHIPAEGETVDTEGWRFEIVDLDSRRIDKVIATRLTEPASPDAAEVI